MTTLAINGRTPARRGPARSPVGRSRSAPPVGTVPQGTTKSVRIRWDRIAALVVAAIALVLMLVSGLVAPSDADVPAAAPVIVVVQAGDTVWELARTHAPEGASVQDYAMQVVLHNDITATALRPGTVLRLPQD